MIILIGGVGYTGKTLMAQKLLEKYSIPYLSIDHLKMGIIRGDQNCGFTALDSVEKINSKLWNIIKGIIMTAIENEQNLIIEGCYLPNDKICDFEKSYLDNIISFYLIFSEQYIRENLQQSILSNRNIIEMRGYDDETNIEELINEHKETKKLCIHYENKFFEIIKNYELEINKVYYWLDQNIVK